MNYSNKNTLRSITVAVKAVIIIGVLLLFLIGCASKSDDSHKLNVVAHRGGAALAPENTLAAFAAALENDVDTVELDIHLSKDGSLMVIHDPLLLRLTGKPGAVLDFTAEELAKFDVAATFKGGKHYFGSQKIPTLEEAVEFIEGNSSRPVHYQIAIKGKVDGSRYEGIEEKLVAALKKYSIMDRTIAISFDFPTLGSLRKLQPDLKLGALIDKEYLSSKGITGPEAVAKNMQDLKVDYVSIKYDFLSQELYDQLKSHGLGVGVWTVDDTINMRKFVKMGVDFISTDRPDLLNQVLDRKVAKPVSSTNAPWYQ